MFSPDELVGQMFYVMKSTAKKITLQVAVLVSTVFCVMTLGRLGYFLVAMVLVSGLAVALWRLLLN